MAKKFFLSCNVYPLTLYHQTLNTDKYEKSVIHVAYTVFYKRLCRRDG